MDILDRTKSLSFSGHRNIVITESLYEKVADIIEKYIVLGYENYFIGMASGFDLLCGVCVVKLQEKYPNIKIIPVVPCDNQTHDFTYMEKLSYKKIMNSAFDIVQTGKVPSAYSMRKRNRYLVDHTSFLLCYLKYNKSGTFYTCNYAYKKGLTVVNIADDLNE